ncbi:MAG: alpha/beta hydrolase [Planctomycetaceae bacterium]|nr:alpha/beta hydrolase [Planctomycetaceae bacterium]
MLAAAIAVSGCAALGPFSPLAPLEQALVFQPQRFPKGDWSPTDLAFEDATFQADDGTRLHGWYLPHPAPQAVVLFAHGNGGNITHYADFLRDLQQRHDVALLGFDYRGYGRCDGKPSETGVVMDARAARRWLAGRTGYAEPAIVLMGHSLGGGVMAQLAAADGAPALILVSTFTSLPDVGNAHTPWLLPQAVMQNRLDSRSALQKFRGPVLISHGDADKLIPINQALALYDAAAGPKQLVTVPGGHHNDGLSDEFHVALDRLLSSLPAN